MRLIRRREYVDTRVPCNGEMHLVVATYDELRLDNHDAGDAEMILAVLGAAGEGGCFDVQRAWRIGDVDALPRALRPLALERWRLAGVAPAAAREFVRGAEEPLPVPVHLRNGKIHPRLDASLWQAALGRRPTPDELRVVRSNGVGDSAEACAWAEALGRPLVTGREVQAALAAGIADGHDAVLWSSATGHVPSANELAQWRFVGVQEGYDALCWAEALGGFVTPALVASALSRCLAALAR